LKLVFGPRTTLTVTDEVRFCTISVLCGENPVMTPPVGTVGVVVGVFVGVRVGVSIGVIVDVAVAVGVGVGHVVGVGVLLKFGLGVAIDVDDAVAVADAVDVEATVAVGVTEYAAVDVVVLVALISSVIVAVAACAGVLVEEVAGLRDPLPPAEVEPACPRPPGTAQTAGCNNLTKYPTPASMPNLFTGMPFRCPSQSPPTHRSTSVAVPRRPLTPSIEAST
jgi:hypothetical protein